MQTPLRAALPLAGALFATLGAVPAQASSTALHGLRQVTSGTIVAPGGFQRRGSVSCPRGFAPLGGGPVVASPAASVNGSFPTAHGWTVDVNTPTGTDTSFVIHLVCARKPKHYALVTSGFVADPAGGAATARATCPAGSS